MSFQYIEGAELTRALGHAIHQRRQEHDMSAYRLAKMAGVSHVTILNCENGLTCPRIETVLKIVDLLSLDLDAVCRVDGATHDRYRHQEFNNRALIDHQVDHGWTVPDMVRNSGLSMTTYRRFMAPSPVSANFSKVISACNRLGLSLKEVLRARS